MNQNDMFVLVLLFLLAVLLVACAYVLFKYTKGKHRTRRRWARVKVPTQKSITCRITEPAALADETEYLVNDINVGGISFFTDKEVEKTALKLQVRFPFTTFKEASTVWGKVIYCNRLDNSENYRVGISYMRHTKRGR
ncbi:MAG: PilZ domain-containing protein [Candidatus Omnitrophica bacterium]|nr:PilZ domain-containing protein [Candidatus Omnitrophota bacterium]